jgi:Mg/Co/Ni transporter MgtE
MESQDRKEIVENLSYLIQVRDTAKLKNLIVDIHPADLAVNLSEMEEQPAQTIYSVCSNRKPPPMS